MLLVNPSGCLLFAVPKQVYFDCTFVQHQPNYADNIIIYLDDTDNTVHLVKRMYHVLNQYDKPHIQGAPHTFFLPYRLK